MCTDFQIILNKNRATNSLLFVLNACDSQT